MTDKVNFGRVAEDYAKYRDDLPGKLFEQMAEKGFIFQGKRAVDLGSGTGMFCRALAVRGVEVTGVEVSQPLLDEAYHADRQRGLAISYVNRRAEDTGLPGNQYDFVSAVRAWHWFDRSAAIAEVLRLLKPDGLLCVIDCVFLPENNPIAQQTIDIVRKFMKDGVLLPAGSKAETKERKNGFPANWFDEWERSGLILTDSWQLDYDLPYTSETWRGKVRSISWMTSLDPETRMQADLRLKNYLDTQEELFHIPNRCSIAILKK